MDKTNNKNQSFVQGQLVFAKVGRHPPWPARIVKIDNNKCGVYFFGTEETANVAFKNVFNYDEANKTIYINDKNLKKKHYKEAVEQINKMKVTSDPSSDLQDEKIQEVSNEQVVESVSEVSTSKPVKAVAKPRKTLSKPTTTKALRKRKLDEPVLKINEQMDPPHRSDENIEVSVTSKMETNIPVPSFKKQKTEEASEDVSQVAKAHINVQYQSNNVDSNVAACSFEKARVEEQLKELSQEKQSEINESVLKEISPKTNVMSQDSSMDENTPEDAPKVESGEENSLKCMHTQMKQPQLEVKEDVLSMIQETSGESHKVENANHSMNKAAHENQPILQEGELQLKTISYELFENQQQDQNLAREEVSSDFPSKIDADSGQNQVQEMLETSSKNVGLFASNGHSEPRCSSSDLVQKYLLNYEARDKKVAIPLKKTIESNSQTDNVMIMNFGELPTFERDRNAVFELRVFVANTSKFLTDSVTKLNIEQGLYELEEFLSRVVPDVSKFTMLKFPQVIDYLADTISFQLSSDDEYLVEMGKKVRAAALEILLRFMKIFGASNVLSFLKSFAKESADFQEKIINLDKEIVLFETFTMERLEMMLEDSLIHQMMC